jgi:hypothetical protein
MSAGYIQLAAVGQQDAYLTGSPEVTYFAGVYKRHTPFVLEAYDIPFQNQSVVYGQNNICKIPPKGDLIRALTLKVDLPPLFDPGSFWAWPSLVSTNFDPKIIVNGTPYVLPVQGFTYYSTYNINSWLSADLKNYISYSSSTNQIFFSNCATIEVDNTGIFWGLDPKLGTVSPNNSSNLVYSFAVSPLSNLAANVAPSNLTANYTTYVSTGSYWTLEQAGWIRSTGLPTVNTRTSLFLILKQNYTIYSTLSYLDFFKWTNQDFTSFYQVNTSGRLNFTVTGTYIVRASFYLGTGSVLNISYGSDTDNGVPVNPVFTYSADFRVSPDPSMPLHMPLIVSSTSNNYYFYAQTTSTVTRFAPGTYLTVTPVDDIYQFNQTVNIPAQTSTVVPFYSNVITPANQTVKLAPDHSITFGATGTWLLSGVVYLKQPTSGLTANYVSNVSVWHGSTVDYAYTTLSTVGRDPTFAFSMPISVQDITQKYYTNIYTNNSTTILGQTYYSILQIGAQSFTDFEYVLSNQGILLNPETQVQRVGSETPFNFKTNWQFPTGTTDYSTIISVNPSTGNLNFQQVGTYMLTSVLSSSDNIKSIRFGSSTYNFDFASGIFQQYTVNIPYRVETINTDVPIVITTVQAGATTNMFSNTYMAVYPLASNVLAPQTYNYHDSVGTWLVNHADLIIGGQTVQTLTGEYIEIYNDLYVPYENQPGLKLLTGKYDLSQIYPPGRTYYINLPFYFYQNPGLALPIAALNRQDIEVHVTFRNLAELTNTHTQTITTPLTATIITEYVYLAEPEINWFKKSQVNYIIRQCQYQTFELGENFISGILKLNFLNPIRELFFVVQIDGTDPYVYSDLNSMALNFNSSEAFTSDVTDSIYLNCIEPFNNYINYPTRNFYMYSFTKQTNTPVPYGHVNFSRIRDVSIQLNTNAYPSTKQFRVIGVNYNILSIKDGIAGLMFNSNDY